jgi:hypothetical protein
MTRRKKIITEPCRVRNLGVSTKAYKREKEPLLQGSFILILKA